MTVQIKVDRQGRIVIPLSVRQRLGVAEGGTLEMISTAEGVLLERRQTAHIYTADDGLPVVTIQDLDVISNDATLDAIRNERDRK